MALSGDGPDEPFGQSIHIRKITINFPNRIASHRIITRLQLWAASKLRRDLYDWAKKKTQSNEVSKQSDLVQLLLGCLAGFWNFAWANLCVCAHLCRKSCCCCKTRHRQQQQQQQAYIMHVARCKQNPKSTLLNNEISLLLHRRADVGLLPPIGVYVCRCISISLVKKVCFFTLQLNQLLLNEH